MSEPRCDRTISVARYLINHLTRDQVCPQCGKVTNKDMLIINTWGDDLELAARCGQCEYVGPIKYTGKEL